MGELKTYNKKRNFKKTAEPEGKVKGSKGKVIFMIQKHEASRLHFDFRIEVDGVLKSWAVPKGPPHIAKERHLAMMVEDHPYDYRTFEGTIPEGEYGGGTVMLWDEGTYYVPIRPTETDKNGKPKLEWTDEMEKDPDKIQEHVNEMIKHGSVKLYLEGKKLKGKFALVRFKTAGEHAWLMIKDKDEYEGKKIKNEDLSVKTGRTMLQITKDEPGKKKVNFDHEDDSDSELDSSESLEAKQPVLDKPSTIYKPMLATLVDKPFNNEDWVFEIKWDGYRSITNVHKQVELISRNGIILNKDYPPIVEALSKFKDEMVLDGEITVVNDDGVSEFQLLQNYRRYGNKAEGNLIYYVFDILSYKGKSLEDLSFIERRKILKKALKQSEHIKLSDFIEETGNEFFALAEKRGLEGIIAKHKDSTYSQGTRSEKWLKIKSVHEQEVVVGGYTHPEGQRKEFGSLLIGVMKNGKLKYVGHTGSGFTEKTLKEIKEKLDKYKANESPFDDAPEMKNVAQWVKPKVLAQVKFQGWTENNQMRQAIFLGLREDKPAKEVNKESAKPTSDIVKSK